MPNIPRLTHLPLAPVGEWKTSKRPTNEVKGMVLQDRVRHEARYKLQGA